MNRTVIQNVIIHNLIPRYKTKIVYNLNTKYKCCSNNEITNNHYTHINNSVKYVVNNNIMCRRMNCTTNKYIKISYCIIISNDYNKLSKLCSIMNTYSSNFDCKAIDAIREKEDI